MDEDLSGGNVTRGRKNSAISPPMPRRSAVTSQAVSTPLPAARETRMKPDQMHRVAINENQPVRREVLGTVTAEVVSGVELGMDSGMDSGKGSGMGVS